MRKEAPTFSDLLERAGKTPAMLEVERVGSISTTYRAIRGTKPDRLWIERAAHALNETPDGIEAAIERSRGRKGKRGPKPAGRVA